MIRGGMTVREVRGRLADLPDDLPVDLLVDHALAGHGDAVTDCNQFDVELLAPVIAVERGPVAVEVRVDWEALG